MCFEVFFCPKPSSTLSGPFYPPHPTFSIKNHLNFQRNSQQTFPKAVPMSLSQSILPITPAQRTEDLVFKASAQSSLPQTTAYPCRPVDPRQNACLLPFTPCSQYSLTKAGVRPFCPVRPRSNRPSLPMPFQASISCPEGSHSPFSHFCLAKIKSACTSLKIRYRALFPATLDLTKTCKTCFADAILPRKSEHRHSQ